MKKSLQRVLVLVTLLILLSSIVLPVSGNLTQRQLVSKEPVFSSIDFNETILSYMSEAHWPSVAVAIVKNQSMVWSKGYGYADVRHKREATNKTVYLLASISKTFTATAIMQLWEKGLFNLDDDINEYLPFSVRNPNYPDVPITFRMLLCHRSGITSNYVSLFILFSVLRLPISNIGEFLTPGGRLYSPKNWENFAPGEKQIYSCVGYELLGYLVERLTNQSFTEYCVKNIFLPLNMKNTSYFPSSYSSEQLATQYVYLFGRYVPLPDFEDRNYASGGVRSNLEDLSHYLIAFMNGGEYQGVRILQNDTVHLMFTLQYPGNEFIRYGLGWEIYTSHNESNVILRIGHNGGMPSVQTYMFYHVSEDAGIIILENQHLFYTWNDLSYWFSLIDLLAEKSRNY